MTKRIVTIAVLLIAGAMPAFASYAPIKYSSTRAKIAVSCAALGARGEAWGLDRTSGAFGCRDTENGNAVDCSADGLCKDYSGDPRWKRIQILLKGGTPEKQHGPIRADREA